MNKRGMSLFTLVLVLTALTIGLAITMGDLSIEQVRNVSDNLTIDNINFDTIQQPHLQDALNSWVNGLLQAYVSLMKWTMEYAAVNPEIPYKLLMTLLILAIAAPLLVSLFKFLIIVFLLIKEFFQSRKEKKRLKNYKGGKFE